MNMAFNPSSMTCRNKSLPLQGNIFRLLLLRCMVWTTQDTMLIMSCVVWWMMWH